MNRIRDAGYVGLVLLTLALPFDLRYQPLVKHGLFTVTNLGVLVYAVATLALVTLSVPVVSFARNLATATHDPTNYLYRQRVSVLLFVALLLSCTISAFLAHRTDASLFWILNLLAGGLVWLAIPLWLAYDTEAKVKRIGTIVVIGAVIAALVGFVELLWGPGFDQNLVGFKEGATKMGPYLRLSSTFSHANVAAMWFGLALPFAIAGLADALTQSAKRGATMVLWLIAIDVLLAALLLTYSRGGLLGVAVGSSAMAVATRGHWQLKRRLREWRWVLVLGVDLGMVIGSFALSSSPVEALRLSSLDDRDLYTAAYTSALPATMRAGQTVTVRVTIENRSAVTWRASGSSASKLFYHWLYSTRQMEELQGIRTELHSDLGPSGEETVVARVRAPQAAGSYFLVWDMVLGNGTWFSLRSAQYQALPVRVIDGSRGNGTHVTVKLPGPAAPTELPTAPPPDRAQIWSVALRMIESHPLFGLGPQGVRLHYAAFAKTPRSIYGFHSPGHAHSLFLEIAADFGLVGGGLFLAWFITVWWPVIRGIWRAQILNVWQVALVGAMGMLLGNGLVDYTLQSLSLFILFWLAGGLATTLAEPRVGADG